MYRILSLDGGGIRGVLTATLLDRLDTAVPGFLDKVNMFAGTSTGGLLWIKSITCGSLPRLRACRTSRPALSRSIF